MEHSESEKKTTVLDAMHFIASSWNAVSQSTIANLFKHRGLKRETASSAGDATTSMPLEADACFANDDFERLNLTTTFADYVEADDNIAICGEVSLDDAIEEALPSADTTATSDKDNDDATDAVPVPTTFVEVLGHIDGTRNFICSRDPAENLLLDVAQLERKLLVHGSNKVQKKLTDFF
ncbi:hypothetical protein V5799_012667 [Amblyomma americanum]|uniref:DDE-1 domain-containing protein n=1 Tax=Amblyomma americanum TaxID=6943 RepID=A0AAQ4EDC7_AMBAM